MDENVIELFKNSIKHADVPEEIIEKYRGKVSDDIISLWKEYGFCTTEDGYYKLVNPDDYVDILGEIYKLEDDEDPVVVMVTGMADIIIYEIYDNHGQFIYIDLRHQKCGGVGRDRIPARRLKTVDFRHTILSWGLYEDAVEKLGVPAYDECFGYEPLVSLGGKEKLENLRKVNLLIHLDIVSQMQERATF